MSLKTKVTNPKTDGFDGEFHEFSEDQEGLRIIEVGKQKYNVVMEQGLWRIVPQGGKIPKELQGRFTSVRLAEQAIEVYTNNRRQDKLAKTDSKPD